MNYIAFGMSPELEPLGEAVRAARKAQGLTIQDLARASGMSSRFLSDLELGKGNVSIARLLEVARALEVPIQNLVAPLDAPSAKKSAAKSKIALVGLRGAGKSTIGKRAAKKLDVPFVELDQEIEATAGMPLQQIFEIYGEGYFRRLERETIARVIEASATGAVIATSGGIVMDAESWRLLKRSTRTVWLRAKPEEHYKRVVAQGDDRPMRDRPYAMAELRALLAARAPLYAEADVTVDTSASNVGQAVDRVVEISLTPNA